ncbi:hypothetical protein DdX_17125 [Ditylenchus destructor]|uniref:Uncharacterized protein n=1 Tax=Ditylenchus destructor TaxID=166010 RepID=A0AAD4MM96_9BILA|nr:hypothetical protein DdX_17125 [Ditylenchus destructor]
MEQSKIDLPKLTDEELDKAIKQELEDFKWYLAHRTDFEDGYQVRERVGATKAKVAYKVMASNFAFGTAAQVADLSEISILLIPTLLNLIDRMEKRGSLYYSNALSNCRHYILLARFSIQN